MDIIVVRHGETEWNAINKIQGQKDIELNENGRNQARQTGEIIKNKSIDLIIASSLKRAKETAEILNHFIGVQIIEDDRIIEKGWGNYEGITKSEIGILKKTHPFINYVWDYEKNIQYENIEGLQDFCKRIYQFLDEIKQKYSNKNILIVTHGGVAAIMKCYFENKPLENLHDRENISGLNNCEFLEYSI